MDHTIQLTKQPTATSPPTRSQWEAALWEWLDDQANTLPEPPVED